MTDKTIERGQCAFCKFYGGTTTGRFKIGKGSGSTSFLACDYYIKTGKHRMDDFGTPRSHNEWLFKCDKFIAVTPEEMEERRHHGSITFTKKGAELKVEREKQHKECMKEIKEFMDNKNSLGLKNIFICEKCGSDKFATKDSRNLDGQRIRLRVCEGCGSKFRTVELMIDDVNRIAKSETIHGQVENIKEDICDHYCKFATSHMDDDPDWLIESDASPCVNCPLKKL